MCASKYRDSCEEHGRCPVYRVIQLEKVNVLGFGAHCNCLCMADLSPAFHPCLHSVTPPPPRNTVQSNTRVGVQGSGDADLLAGPIASRQDLGGAQCWPPQLERGVPGTVAAVNRDAAR